MSRVRARESPAIIASLREYGRGIGGGFLFSLPLLFTMEVWADAASIPPGRLAGGFAAAFILLCGYNLFVGLRHDSTIAEVMIDSVEELGIGLVLAAVVLWLLGRLPPEASLHEWRNVIVLEGLFVAVGVSVGTAQLSVGSANDTGGPQGRHLTVWSELVLAFCGAVLVAANVAPTEEILLLASEMRDLHVAATMMLSIALAATLLYFSDFTGSGRFTGDRSLFGVVHGSAITYATALVASACLLWFFGRMDGNGTALNATQCVVLGLAATLGAAAGRLLLR